MAEAVFRMANRYKVTLTQEERARLAELTHSGKTSSAKFIHARALLLCDAGEWGGPVEGGGRRRGVGRDLAHH